MPRDLMQPETGPGKFQGELKIVRKLHELALDGDDGSFGSDDEGGTTYLLVRLSSLDFDGANIGNTRAAIVHENSDGFVTASLFATDDAARAEFARRETDHDNTYGPGVDDDDDDDYDLDDGFDDDDDE